MGDKHKFSLQHSNLSFTTVFKIIFFFFRKRTIVWGRLQAQLLFFTTPASLIFDIAVPHQSWTVFSQRDNSKHDTNGDLESTCAIGHVLCCSWESWEPSMWTIQAGLMGDENSWPEPQPVASGTPDTWVRPATTSRWRTCEWAHPRSSELSSWAQP